MPNKNVITVTDVNKDFYQYGLFGKGKLLTKSLKDISFNVKEGDIFGILGTSGAGKSVLIKILTTRQTKSGGKVKKTTRVWIGIQEK